jgi:cyclopropane fatty-acyl-phospholipid synthase-like methyltransferase
MEDTKHNLIEMMTVEGYPRSSNYEPMWVLENQMGPNVLWLTESLANLMDLWPGMRILDMGCGRAISSIFLAKEFGVQIWATDLWITATDNWKRIRPAGVEDKVFPINAEAHSLPFADEFFDAAISVDAYHYFGTDDLYLGSYFDKLIKHDGQIGVVVPGLTEEFISGVPDYLKPFWNWEFGSFHSPTWWKDHFEKSGKVTVEHTSMLPEGWRLWLKWEEIRRQIQFPYDEDEASILRVDAGRNLGFTRLVARRK